MTTGASSPKQFFRQADTRETIELLAGAGRVTIVVGAGASAEFGLPLWSELVERLLLRALDPETPPDGLEYPESVREAVSRILEEAGALEAATMARAALGEDFYEALRTCLYEWPNHWQWNLPGATARAVADLYKVMKESGQNCEIATTNYDVNLEVALEDVLGEEVMSLCRDSEDIQGRPVVRHLHGVLTQEGKAEHVTLTEADYEAVDREGLPWQESYLRRRFEDSAVVFIGASLTDQHLLRYIFRYAEEEPRPVALLVNDGGALGTVDQREDPGEAESLITDLKRGRWDYVHLTALQADFPFQPAQFLHEVAHHKRHPDSVRYGMRLDDWFRIASRNRFGLHDEESFGISQYNLQEIVQEWLEAVVDRLEGAGYDLSAETLAVHLWCRAPNPLRVPEDGSAPELTSLAMMGCSDRTWTDPRAIDVRLITQPSSRAAVDAFCWGMPKVRLPDGFPKWHWILATPVVLEEHEEFGRLPIGAVSLVSDKDLDASVLGELRKVDSDLLMEIERFLATAAEKAFEL
ncbi:MAG TPA: SIR2 family protein [Solirubrobacterales bacterium]|nr:SIR2 family protein [Solirubrobacterales bacterium]